MSRKRTQTHVRPLLIRPGSRYGCAAIGLCCSDIHKIAPVSRPEMRRLRVLDEDAADFDDEIGEPAIAMHDGECSFLRADGLCDIHQIKPRVCHRFPYTLVATPAGGRVSIEHRCLCPNLVAEAPLVTAHGANRDLNDAAGRLKANWRVERIETDAGTINFADYVKLEATVLQTLKAQPSDVRGTALGTDAFSPLRGSTWREVYAAMVQQEGDTRFDQALRWFGDAIGQHLGIRPRRRERIWETPEPLPSGRPPNEQYMTWIADEVWGLMWTSRSGWDQLRRELATRLWIARAIAKRLRRQLSAEVATAEAIVITDLVGSSPWWDGAVQRL